MDIDDVLGRAREVLPPFTGLEDEERVEYWMRDQLETVFNGEKSFALYRGPGESRTEAVEELVDEYASEIVDRFEVDELGGTEYGEIRNELDDILSPEDVAFFEYADDRYS
ncbi:MAG: hypothetical protein ABEK01_01710 [Candidatus Nanohaloarchaea archaeon]